MPTLQFGALPPTRFLDFGAGDLVLGRHARLRRFGRLQVVWDARHHQRPRSRSSSHANSKARITIGCDPEDYGFAVFQVPLEEVPFICNLNALDTVVVDLDDWWREHMG